MVEGRQVPKTLVKRNSRNGRIRGAQGERRRPKPTAKNILVRSHAALLLERAKKVIFAQRHERGQVAQIGRVAVAQTVGAAGAGEGRDGAVGRDFAHRIVKGIGDVEVA